MSFYALAIGLALYIGIPFYYTRKHKCEALVLLYGFAGLLTLNTTLMAVIRDCGGMEFLKEIGRQRWFAYQYDVSYWAWLVSKTCLAVILYKLIKNLEDKPSNAEDRDTPR